VLAAFGIHHNITALCSPQSNAAERVNRSLLATIRSNPRADQTEWNAN